MNLQCVGHWRRARGSNRTRVKTPEEGSSPRTVSRDGHVSFFLSLSSLLTLSKLITPHLTVSVFFPLECLIFLFSLHLKLYTDQYASSTSLTTDNVGEELGQSPPDPHMLLSGQKQECWLSVRRRRYSLLTRTERTHWL